MLYEVITGYLGVEKLIRTLWLKAKELKPFMGVEV